MLVLVAISLIMIFGFAAIAVDGAMAWSQKRENQAAVDTGALAGAQFIEGIVGDWHPPPARTSDKPTVQLSAQA